ncbi:DUF4102 domain-containing protein [Paraburkholderia panacisoli]|uniref:DUF4102 domain-containing protein n=1 Tax=Paraburkholderia panacisoli TaxID=2603818 RepID=A0A5B0HL88_9BURK|nr:Arm DNA-binding domain-containing protein [Paraburkholderia panacisoli]KAA1015822.1 DUF4102 domain-containing protein [Paraburkholderia panacisoli]
MARINHTRKLLDSIRRAGPDDTHRELADLQKGFGARITPNGTIIFFYRYSAAGGKHRRQIIGGYPAMTVSQSTPPRAGTDAGSRAFERHGDRDRAQARTRAPHRTGREDRPDDRRIHR